MNFKIVWISWTPSEYVPVIDSDSCSISSFGPNSYVQYRRNAAGGEVHLWTKYVMCDSVAYAKLSLGAGCGVTKKSYYLFTIK